MRITQGLALIITLLGGSMTVSALAAGLLHGYWGARDLQLIVDDHGARILGECSTGTIQGPIRLDKNGRFRARGTFELHGGGPQRADARIPRARFTGRLQDGAMLFAIQPDGARQTLQYTLRKGARVKLLRCL